MKIQRCNIWNEEWKSGREVEKQHALAFSSADIPNASGCLSPPDFIRTAQLVQQPAGR